MYRLNMSSNGARLLNMRGFGNMKDFSKYFIEYLYLYIYIFIYIYYYINLFNERLSFTIVYYYELL